MTSDIAIRIARTSDLDDITTIFRSTIISINAEDYSDEQLVVWASAAEDTAVWLQKIHEQHFLVAMYKGVLAGFASITTYGYLDYMYIHKDYQRKGIAHQLLLHLESFAKENGVKVIYTDASITARGFFEKSGYQIITQQAVWRKGISFINYRMEKQL